MPLWNNESPRHFLDGPAKQDEAGASRVAIMYTRGIAFPLAAPSLSEHSEPNVSLLISETPRLAQRIP